MCRMNLLESAACCYGAVVIGTLATSTVSAIVGVVSKYALPKLGYQTISNIPVTHISARAFSISLRSIAAFFLLAFVMFAVESVVLGQLDSHLHTD